MIFLTVVDSFGIGKVPRRTLACPICKSSFVSYKYSGKDKYSHRQHRNRMNIEKFDIEEIDAFDLNLENDEDDVMQPDEF